MNIKDIAKMAGVSKATVSRVINSSPLVTEITKNKVLEVIKKANYNPNFIARSLKIKKTKTIGIVVPDIGNPFYFEVIRGSEKVLDKNGYNFILCNSDYIDEKELQYISLLASKKVDGIILAPTSENSKSVERMKAWNIPFVIVDLPQLSYKNNSMVIDHSRCSYIATKYLIEIGHKKIALIDTFRSIDYTSLFVKGYLKALEEKNIKINKELILETSLDIKGGYDAFKKLINNNIEVTGIICICDLVAIGIYRAADKFKISITDDISVIGNDDIPLARYLDPPLTTIRQPKFKMGYKSAELLLNLLKNKKEHEIDKNYLQSNIRLICRKSTKRRI